MSKTASFALCPMNPNSFAKCLLNCAHGFLADIVSAIIKSGVFPVRTLGNALLNRLGKIEHASEHDYGYF